MKKRILLIAIVALIVLLLVWRFWPSSFSGIMPVDADSVVTFSAAGMHLDLDSDEVYQLDSSQPLKPALGDVLEILGASGYRRDFRNLLPWGVHSVSSDRNYDGRRVSLVFSRGDQQQDTYYIEILSSSLITVSSSGRSGLRIYHPTNRQVLDELATYLQTNGKQP